MSRTVKPTFEEFFAFCRTEPVYVILGVQGSGTNLLRRFLVQAFNFSVMQDKAAVFNAAVRLGPSPSSEAVRREFEALMAGIFPNELRRKLRKPILRLNEPFRGIERHFDAVQIRSGADFARFIYTYRAWSLNTRFMAIKSDDLWEHIPRIDEVLPNRRIILLTRDFRDNLLSICGKNFGPIEPVCAAQYVKERFAHYEAEFLRAGTDALHIRYESLLNEPREFLTSFAARYGLPFVNDADAVVAGLQLRPHKIGKWHRLPAQELGWCEAILRRELQTFGYPPVTAQQDPPPGRALLTVRTRDVFKRVPQKLGTIAERLRS